MTAKRVFQTTLIVVSVVYGIQLALHMLEVFVLLIIAFIYASAISPTVRRFRKHMPLPAAIGLVYLMVILTFALLLAVILPPLITQTGKLVTSGPELIDAAQTQLQSLRRTLRLPVAPSTFDVRAYLGKLGGQAPKVAVGVLNLTIGVVTGLAGLVIVLVAAFYWLLEREGLEGTWITLLPRRKRAEARMIIEEIELRLGGYVRGQLMLAAIVAVLAYIVLLVVGIPYALVLALLAGMFELVPLVGPILSAVAPVLIAFGESPLKALIVAGAFLVIQQVENHLLVPNVMKHSVGLSPLTVLVAILIGTALMGIIGTLLAVPIAAALHVVVQHTVLREQNIESIEAKQLEAREARARESEGALAQNP